MTKNISRRAVLVTGAKYAAIAPASTVLVAKSARAGGSFNPGPYSGGGVTANSIADCANMNPGHMPKCVIHFTAP